MSKRSTIWLVLCCGALLMFAQGCAEPTPEERIAAMRSRYEASINAFSVEQVPVESPETIEPEDADAGSAEADSAEETETSDEGEDGSEETEEPVAVQELQQNVLLDVVIRHESSEKLDGVTVDISMVDGDRELQVWRVWFDTSAIEKGPGSQFSHLLEDVDYQPGYGFGAEIRHPVPPEDRAEYREFSSLGG